MSLAQWELARADSEFRAATELDPQYARAFLWLAQVRQWANVAVVQWQVAAERASAAAVRPVAPVTLEQAIHRELRALPLRPAPRTLEARVLAEIERRATVAWYHRSWSYWPAPVRSAFLVLRPAFAAVAVAAFYRLSQGAAAETVLHDAATGFGWLTRFAAVVGWTFNIIQQLIAAIPHYADRAAVKPGLTGWAQVKYPYGASIEDARDKLSYDLWYIRQRSLWLDLRIILATVRVVLRQAGAR